MTDKEIFLMFTRYLHFDKSPQFLKWAKDKYPYLDLHHIAGSLKGKGKYTDYLIVPIDHKTHLNKVHQDKIGYFIEYLPQAIELLIEYVKHLEDIKNY